MQKSLDFGTESSTSSVKSIVYSFAVYLEKEIQVNALTSAWIFCQAGNLLTVYKKDMRSHLSISGSSERHLLGLVQEEVWC
ncbi:hypothetical protein ASJ81_13110 [Methanosarcina spelaei]|uniref:Uncharacterized protein n=1 Tax=Methanosarcina spelaei TaxID=1036679 RepID=A0A2A2HMU0_9EURY|nr:hypothetical protein ASJ81_13110 [Methanosarcina spelaei]